MSIVAIVPVADIDAANAALEALGNGPDSFSIPLREGTDLATHAGLHCWDHAQFLADLQAVALTITSIEITVNSGLETNGFGAHCAARSLERYDPETWPTDPVMAGDQRTFGGKTWESLIDHNVWLPPSGWHEVTVT